MIAYRTNVSSVNNTKLNSFEMSSGASLQFNEGVGSLVPHYPPSWDVCPREGRLDHGAMFLMFPVSTDLRRCLARIMDTMF